MVPVATVSNALGRPVTFDANTNTVIVQPATITAPKTAKMKLLINNQVVDDITVIDNRAYIPIRDLAGALGHKVTGYDGKSVSIE